jgi:AraC-like DNA-binding protein
MPDVEYRLRPSDSVRESEDHDGILLFDVQQSLCFSVNGVGSRIWRMMKMKQPLAQLVNTLAADFNMPRETVLCDVMTFIEVLNEEGLLLHEVIHRDNRGLSRAIKRGSLPFDVACTHPISLLGTDPSLALDRFPPLPPRRVTPMPYEAPQLCCQRGITSVLDRGSHNALRSSRWVYWRAERIRCLIDALSGSLDWNIDRLSRDLGLRISGPHAARLFKLHTGVDIREYATKRRLALAAERLRKTTRSLKEIAAELGYRTPNDLQRTFKSLFHLNPTEFRIICRGQAVASNTVRHQFQQRTLQFPTARM